MNTIEIKNPFLGTMFLDLDEEDRIKLLDSNKNYVGYVCTDELEKDVKYYVEKLTKIKKIVGLVDLGFCSNMIFGKSLQDLADSFSRYEYDKGCFGKEVLEEYSNIIGSNYILVDFDEL